MLAIEIRFNAIGSLSRKNLPTLPIHEKSNIFMIIAVFMVRDVAYGTMGGHGLGLLLATQLGSGDWEHAILVLSLMVK